jgi:hypothetical protein
MKHSDEFAKAKACRFHQPRRPKIDVQDDTLLLYIINISTLSFPQSRALYLEPTRKSGVQHFETCMTRVQLDAYAAMYVEISHE